MASQWDFFQCKVNGRPASIYLDMALKRSAPDKQRHALLVIRVDLQLPHPANGLSTDAEFDALAAIEDQLTEALKEDLGALYAGRITTAGRREFYFYAKGAGDIGSITRAALSTFAGYRIKAWSQADPLWKHYADVLYPRGASLRWITNKAVLAALAARGDQPDALRPITHCSYFPSAGQRAAFMISVENAGFATKSMTDTGRSADVRPYGLLYEIAQSATLSVITDTTGLLTLLSEKHGGQYEGWEAPLAGTPKRPWWRFWSS